MEAINNITPSVIYVIQVLISRGTLLKVWWDQYTQEKTLIKGVYINPLPSRNSLKFSLWGFWKNVSGHKNQFIYNHSYSPWGFKCVRIMGSSKWSMGETEILGKYPDM